MLSRQDAKKEATQMTPARRRFGCSDSCSPVAPPGIFPKKGVRTRINTDDTDFSKASPCLCNGF
jgi:hypothetical protein